jgi:hypothetical protein
VIHIRGYLNLEVAKQLLVTIKSRIIANDGAWMVGMTINIFLIRNDAAQIMGSAGFEPANSSARGWHHTMLDNDPVKHG